MPAEVVSGAATVLGASVPALDGSVSGKGVALVRPESVTVAKDEDGNATVASVGFLGPISRIYADLPDGQHLMAQVPSSQVEGLAPGDRVRVGVQPAPVLVVEA